MAFPLGKGIRKYINYTKEAFFWPFHLVGAGIIATVTTASMVLLYNWLNLDTSGLLFIGAGLELMFLAGITRSRRFRRAINMKYRAELQSYAYVAKLTEYYNSLSAKAQRRFEEFRGKLMDAKQSYLKLNERFPDLVNEYQRKIDSLQLQYLRLLNSFDKMPDLMRQDDPEILRRQIDEIRGGMGDDGQKLREIKEKRIKLLQDRIRNFNSAIENAKLIEEQLRTIEEMVKYFQEQPLAERSGDGVSLIDNLLTETSDLHNTLSTVEDIMRSDLQMPDLSGSDVWGRDEVLAE